MLKKLLVALIFMEFIMLGTVTLVANPPELVSARIGIEIQSGTERRPAKASERVQAVDRFRIYTLPETQAMYVYVVFADQKTAELLNAPESTSLLSDSLLLLPGCDEWYAFESLGLAVMVTIISSATPLPELETVLQKPENLPQWHELETKLIAQSKIELSTAALKPYVIAGSTRDCNSAESDAFLAELKISSGKGVVIKKYEFRIQE